jgi:hypothetical protein
MIRRQAPAIVRDAPNDPRVNRPIIDFSLTRSYVAAPVMPTGRVIGPTCRPAVQRTDGG